MCDHLLVQTIPHCLPAALFALTACSIPLTSCSSSEDAGKSEGGDGDTGSGGSDPGSGGMAAGTGGGTPTSVDCALPELNAPLAAPTETLSVLNWAGKSAALSYTFDDATSSQVQAYDAINALGVPFTFYVTTNWIADPSTWIQALADGQEIGNHTQTHPMAATDAELDGASSYIEETIGVVPLTMAAPYGDTSYSNPAMSRFLLNRGVGGGSIAPLGSTNLYNLPTFTPAENADKDALDAGVSGALSQGNWQTVLIHGFADYPDSSYLPISLDGFVTHVKALRDAGNVWIDTMLAIGSYFIGQKLLMETTPTTNGADSTYAFTVPPHFPEGGCLRIQSTGTVLQNGQEIPQHPNGYYDVSLAAGEITIRN